MDAAFYLPSGLGDDEDEENIVLGGQGGGSSWLQGLGGDVLDEANNDVYYTERDPSNVLFGGQAPARNSWKPTNDPELNEPMQRAYRPRQATISQRAAQHAPETFAPPMRHGDNNNSGFGFPMNQEPYGMEYQKYPAPKGHGQGSLAANSFQHQQFNSVDDGANQFQNSFYSNSQDRGMAAVGMNRLPFAPPGFGIDHAERSPVYHQDTPGQYRNVEEFGKLGAQAQTLADANPPKLQPPPRGERMAPNRPKQHEQSQSRSRAKPDHHKMPGEGSSERPAKKTSTAAKKKAANPVGRGVMFSEKGNDQNEAVAPVSARDKASETNADAKRKEPQSPSDQDSQAGGSPASVATPPREPVKSSPTSIDTAEVDKDNFPDSPTAQFPTETSPSIGSATGGSRTNSISSSDGSELDLAYSVSQSSSVAKKRRMRRRQQKKQKDVGVVDKGKHAMAQRSLSRSVGKSADAMKSGRSLSAGVHDLAAGSIKLGATVFDASMSVAVKNANHILFNASRVFEAAMALFGVLLSAVLGAAVVVLNFLCACHYDGFLFFLRNNHIGFCYLFLYLFPSMVGVVFAWAPPWGAVCLWYTFLVQCFWPSKRGGSAVAGGGDGHVTNSRWAKLLLPLAFLLEGVSHKSFLLGLTGGERLVIAYVISSLMTEVKTMLFFLVFATQVLMSAFLGGSWIAQWGQFMVAVFGLRLTTKNNAVWGKEQH